MVKELDILLSNIEGGGGLGGTRTAFQEHSVLELEAGLEDLSERCRIWKVIYILCFYTTVMLVLSI